MHYRTIVISDLHLGALDTKYEELLNFLEKNTCEQLILNGDIIDGRHIKVFGSRPPAHTKVLKKILNIAENNNTKVTYIKGNHDEFWTNIAPITLGKIEIINDLIYLSGKKTYYICHGHQLDKRESKLRGITYLSFIAGSFLFWLNRTYNKRRAEKGYTYFSLVHRIKQGTKIIMVGGQEKFQKKIQKLTQKNGCTGIICGHLHKPENTMIGTIHYLNSGDRVEACTAIVEHTDHSRELLTNKK